MSSSEWDCRMQAVWLVKLRGGEYDDADSINLFAVQDQERAESILARLRTHYDIWQAAFNVAMAEQREWQLKNPKPCWDKQYPKKGSELALQQWRAEAVAFQKEHVTAYLSECDVRFNAQLTKTMEKLAKERAVDLSEFDLTNYILDASFYLEKVAFLSDA